MEPNLILGIIGDTDPGGDRVLLLGVCITTGFAVWKSWCWFQEGVAPPDPWSASEAAALEQPDAQPLCLRCLEAHPDDAHFCPKCGAPTGEYTTFSPYLYLFALGDVLRQGTSGRFRVCPCTMAGYVLMSFTQYVIFAPIYWYLLARNIRSQKMSAAPTEATDGVVGPPRAD